jgi:hypothetical protein
MNKYVYNVTGDYKDWLEMKKGDTVFHNGSLIGLISYANNRLELKLNYGTDSNYLLEIKKLGNIIITVPIEEHLLNAEYMYIPLVFEKDEYEAFIEIAYIDRELLKNIRQANKQDIHNMLLGNFKYKFNISEYLKFDDVINNIIAFSGNDIELSEGINHMSSNDSVYLQRIGGNESQDVVVFIDLSGKLYEWNLIIKIDNKFYFKIVEDYILEL